MRWSKVIEHYKRVKEPDNGADQWTIGTTKWALDLSTGLMRVLVLVSLSNSSLLVMAFITSTRHCLAWRNVRGGPLDAKTF